MTVAKDNLYAWSFQTSETALAILSPDKKFFDVNPAMAMLLDFDRGELLNLDPTEIYHPADRDEIHQNLERASQGKSQDCYQMTCRLITKYGGIKQVTLNLAASDLGAFIQVQTQSLSHIAAVTDPSAQMTVATAKADDESQGLEKVDSLVTEICTEFRGPIRSFNQILSHLYQMDDRQSKDRLEVIAQLQMVSKMASQLLTVMASTFQSSADEARPRTKKVELDPFIQNLIEVLSYKALPLGISLEYSKEADVPHEVALDEAKIRLILYLIMNHSMDYSSRGRLKIAVATKPELLTFTISDSGRSLSDKELQQFFQPFNISDVSSNNHESKVERALIKYLVQAIGGSVSASSNANEGLVFYLSVNFQVVQVQSSEPRGSESEQRSLRTVLIVDDEDTMRHVLGHQIEKLGYKVAYACDGLDGLQKYDPKTIDLIVTDVSMPKLNGLQMLRMIQKATPQIAAIVVSGRPETRRSANNLGALFFEKPYNIPSLLTSIQEILGKKVA